MITKEELELLLEKVDRVSIPGQPITPKRLEDLDEDDLPFMEPNVSAKEDVDAEED